VGTAGLSFAVRAEADARHAQGRRGELVARIKGKRNAGAVLYAKAAAQTLVEFGKRHGLCILVCEPAAHLGGLLVTEPDRAVVLQGFGKRA
jgi:hypothetical protein